MSPPTAAIPGYDVPAVEAWIAAHVSGLTPPLRWTRLEGGHSNLTYRLDDAPGRAASGVQIGHWSAIVPSRAA